MNAVEIEEALSELASQPFDPVEFPYTFLAALGNKEVTLKRLRKGDTNASDVPGAVLQRSNIHLAVCTKGDVAQTLRVLRDSPKTAQAKAKFVLATDGVTLEAEDLGSGEVLTSDFPKFANHFAFFLPLAGISTVKEIKENPIDVKATGRLNKLYVELLKNNPGWTTDARRPDMNHFMARLVFCYFAEDTDIFHGSSLFTSTLGQVTESDGSNTHTVLETIFKAMNVPTADRPGAKFPAWAARFPYVNGGLFSGSTDVPTFTRTARSYLLRAGDLNWSQINPDIFGSMIQAVADDEERGSLGMHYTSVPNILKVLNPLFLDDLRSQLEAAGDNKAKLLNLRKRMSRIRVFDPACGSGNFLVIAYKQIRQIEWEINKRRSEPDLRTEIPLTNFRGIELRDFPAEIARLALIIAEFQCDVLYRGQKEALAEVLPLDSQNWITCDNALRLDWLAICPPTGTGVKFVGDDLFNTPLNQAEIDFQNEGGETYICGNPPYKGSKWQTPEQKADLKSVFHGISDGWKSLDYISGWWIKAALYIGRTKARAAFVTTNSICQGMQVPLLWPDVFATGSCITFAHTSFKWSNLATDNAGVTVAIVGIAADQRIPKRLFSLAGDGSVVERQVEHINAYLVPAIDVQIEQSRDPISGVSQMLFGNMPRDGGGFVLSGDERSSILNRYPELARFIRPYLGSEQMIQGKPRWCIWIEDVDADFAAAHPFLETILSKVRHFRMESAAASTRDFASRPYRFVQIAGVAKSHSIAVAKVSSERRAYLPVDLVDGRTIISDLLFALYDAPLWNLALIASRLHLVWIATVCGKMKTDFRYSNTLGWNTFPVPTLTSTDKENLQKCAIDILIAREQCYPKTISELYAPDAMPGSLQRAHERNDETLERIYIGRRFKNDTERLERLFDLYTKMRSANATRPRAGRRKTEGGAR
jgi:hypothetical protein